MASAAAPTGASATSRPRRRCRSSTRAGPTSSPPARSSIPAACFATPTPSGCSAPERLEKGLALAAVGRDLVGDPAALDQVEAVEALAELAGLDVAEVGAVPDPQRSGRVAEQRLARRAVADSGDLALVCHQADQVDLRVALDLARQRQRLFGRVHG